MRFPGGTAMWLGSDAAPSGIASQPIDNYRCRRYNSLPSIMRILAALFLFACATPSPAQRLGRGAAQADLDTLRARVHRYSAYRRLNDFPFDRHLDSLRAGLPDSIPLSTFWHSVQALVGRLQDAHSNVPAPPAVVAALPGGELPFALTSAGDTIVAMHRCACALWVERFPQIVSINDVRVDSLMRIAGFRFRGHSPQRFRLRALRALTRIEDALSRASALRGQTLSVRLRSMSGDTVVTVPMAPRGSNQTPARSVSSEMAGNIAVLRIPLMYDQADTVGGGDVGYATVRAAWESRSFRDSRAIIIDLRDNDGGARDILELIAPTLIQAPLAYNIAVARADTNEVGLRSLFTPDDRSRPETARAALRTALDAFRPSWNYAAVDTFLPVGLGAVLMPAGARSSVMGKPIVVLMDEGSFSATDIFLGAMRLIPNVTLMGTPSGGGSGRSRAFPLPNSRLRVVLSTMASFQVNGQPYDAGGIVPDVLVPRTIEGLATGRDTQMQEAIRFLRARIGGG